MSASLNARTPAPEPNPAGSEPGVIGARKPGFFYSEIVKSVVRGVVISGFVLAAVGVSLLAFRLFRSDTEAIHSDLDIVAAITKAPDGLSVTGRVLYEGVPATNARIWCIARDEAGNRFTPTNTLMSLGGHFRLDGLPVELTNQDSEVRVFARSTQPGLFGGGSLRGQVIIMTKARGRQINIMDSKLWPCTLGLFGVSIIVGFAIQVVSPVWRRQLYIASVITALGLTAGMLFGIAEAYMRVKASVTAGQAWSVGFISIFEGTYMKDLPEQWLLSLTGPPRDQPSGTAPAARSNSPKGESASRTQSSDPATLPAAPIQGLGAPMWVVFLSVIGAALSTVALVVKEIRSPPCFFMDDPVELRQRMLTLVQNQFFMLFAPLGSIFVYQGLVLAGAAAQPFVVAVAALGAGATLNSLLSVAVSKAEEALQPDSKKGKAQGSTDTSGDGTEQPVVTRSALKPLNAGAEKETTPQLPHQPKAPVGGDAPVGK